jgi:adenosine deaminase
MKCFDPVYNAIPKMELHCHLGGSLRTATIVDIARSFHLELPSYEVDILNRYVQVREQLQDLQSVLDAFAIAQRCFVSPAVVERLAYEAFEEAAQQNVRLFELRFSPDWAFRTHDLDWDAAFEGILRAQERAEARWPIAIGLIAMTTRIYGVGSCEKTVDWAIRWRDRIHGIDLADSEVTYPIGDFVRPVLKARDAGLRVTVHSGEDTPASYVVRTIHAVHPARIGHGIHVIEDDAAIELVKTCGITLEVCPWSNYLTHSVSDIEAHPLKRLYDLGVKVTINSDDPGVLDTNLNNEYRIAHEILGMSLDEIAHCNRYALEASFLPDKRKAMVGSRAEMA